MTWNRVDTLLSKLSNTANIGENPKETFFEMNALFDEFKSGELRLHPPTPAQFKDIQSCITKLYHLIHWSFLQNTAYGLQHAVLDLPLADVLEWLGISESENIMPESLIMTLLNNLSHHKREVRDAHGQLFGAIASVYPPIVTLLLTQLSEHKASTKGPIKWELLEGFSMALGWAGRRYKDGLSGDLLNQVLHVIIDHTKYTDSSGYSPYVRFQSFRALARLSNQTVLNTFSSEQWALIQETILSHIGDPDINVRRAVAAYVPQWVFHDMSQAETRINSIISNLETSTQPHYKQGAYLCLRLLASSNCLRLLPFQLICDLMFILYQSYMPEEHRNYRVLEATYASSCGALVDIICRVFGEHTPLKQAGVTHVRGVVPNKQDPVSTTLETSTEEQIRLISALFDKLSIKYENITDIRTSVFDLLLTPAISHPLYSPSPNLLDEGCRSVITLCKSFPKDFLHHRLDKFAAWTYRSIFHPSLPIADAARRTLLAVAELLDTDTDGLTHRFSFLIYSTLTSIATTHNTESRETVFRALKSIFDLSPVPDFFFKSGDVLKDCFALLVVGNENEDGGDSSDYPRSAAVDALRSFLIMIRNQNTKTALPLTSEELNSMWATTAKLIPKWIMDNSESLSISMTNLLRTLVNISPPFPDALPLDANNHKRLVFNLLPFLLVRSHAIEDKIRTRAVPAITNIIDSLSNAVSVVVDEENGTVRTLGELLVHIWHGTVGDEESDDVLPLTFNQILAENHKERYNPCVLDEDVNFDYNAQLASILAYSDITQSILDASQKLIKTICKDPSLLLVNLGKVLSLQRASGIMLMDSVACFGHSSAEEVTFEGAIISSVLASISSLNLFVYFVNHLVSLNLGSELPESLKQAETVSKNLLAVYGSASLPLLFYVGSKGRIPDFTKDMSKFNEESDYAQKRNEAKEALQEWFDEQKLTEYSETVEEKLSAVLTNDGLETALERVESLENEEEDSEVLSQQHSLILKAVRISMSILLFPDVPSLIPSPFNSFIQLLLKNPTFIPHTLAVATIKEEVKKFCSSLPGCAYPAFLSECKPSFDDTITESFPESTELKVWPEEISSPAKLVLASSLSIAAKGQYLLSTIPTSQLLNALKSIILLSSNPVVSDTLNELDDYAVFTCSLTSSAITNDLVKKGIVPHPCMAATVNKLAQTLACKAIRDAEEDGGTVQTELLKTIEDSVKQVIDFSKVDHSFSLDDSLALSIVSGFLSRIQRISERTTQNDGNLSGTAVAVLGLLSQDQFEQLLTSLTDTLALILRSISQFLPTAASRNINHTHVIQMNKTTGAQTQEQIVLSDSLTSVKDHFLAFQNSFPQLVTSCLLSLVHLSKLSAFSSLSPTHPLIPVLIEASQTKLFRTQNRGTSGTNLCSLLIDVCELASPSDMMKAQLLQGISDLVADEEIGLHNYQSIIFALSGHGTVEAVDGLSHGLNLPNPTPPVFGKSNETFGTE
ncbi:hypothetical protein BLNAU_8378 [Blattamonas nauphoetae]|uniref:Uncharacterized protein n=1 Tax=Blattamonas nauphoetae TaxID=2049346 RepID=A0ABQ9XZ44_9EUKA|nr:hypothetical protein BLNAU_8378 [Blattamonas nauphoetae]